MLKRVIVVCGLLVLLCSPGVAGTPDGLAYMDIGELQELMDQGALTSVELVAYYVQRIAEIDRAGPKLGAVIELNPEAFVIAAKLDQERAKSGPRGPMHGIPVLLKANIDTGDRMETTAGSLALRGHHAPDDAFHVQALRDAGAVILGKTNLSEWANFRGSNSSSGWSSIGGQTRNPYSLDRNPCGSSSGSGVAVAAGLVTVAIGTETDGSVVCPSGVNGIVGIKPTVGLVSRDGIIPIAHTQDTAGPMARSVRDAAILLTAISEKDPDDAASDGHPGPTDYAADLDRNALEGRRIGVWRGYWGAKGNPKVAAIFDQVVANLTQLGATVVDPVELEIPDEANDSEYEVLLYEFKDDLNRYLAGSNVDRSVDTLTELIEFNRANADAVMPWFGQEDFEKAEAKGPLSDPEYREALEASHVQVAKLIDSLFDSHHLDAVIAPTNGPSWVTDWVNGDSFSLSSSSAAAVSGYPAVTIPMGEIHGLPIGVSLIGTPYSEKQLIGLAYALEQKLQARRNPDFRKSMADAQ
ncbi:MAG: amidase [Acidobacteria bacterium]|jgi:amidase|nr:amidase [Acidobacteriota bacterium]